MIVCAFIYSNIFFIFISKGNFQYIIEFFEETWNYFTERFYWYVIASHLFFKASLILFFLRSQLIFDNSYLMFFLCTILFFYLITFFIADNSEVNTKRTHKRYYFAFLYRRMSEKGAGKPTLEQTNLSTHKLVASSTFTFQTLKNEK